MRSCIISGTAGLCLLIGLGAHAANSQQDKMTSCNANASSQALKGDARKAYMKSCLSGSSDASAPSGGNSQQQKMKTCNASAKSQALSGDARKAFMKSCLSGG